MVERRRPEVALKCPSRCLAVDNRLWVKVFTLNSALFAAFSLYNCNLMKSHEGCPYSLVERPFFVEDCVVAPLSDFQTSATWLLRIACQIMYGYSAVPSFVTCSSHSCSRNGVVKLQGPTEQNKTLTVATNTEMTSSVVLQ